MFLHGLTTDSYNHFCSMIYSALLRCRHGVAPVESSEPSYVAATIFQDQASYEKWSKNDARTEVDGDVKREKVFYEGTLVINSGE